MSVLRGRDHGGQRLWGGRAWVLCGALAAGVLLAPLLHAQVFLAVDGAQYETCSGAFHDSGGPAGDYSNSEDITVTVCPVGGPGAGPLTKITFTQWVVAAGDALTIHDGPDVTGPVLAVGSTSNSLLNLSFTASAPHGCLTFRWLSDASGTAAGWTATIDTGADAGTDASITVCSDAVSFLMRPLLGGTPDPGGTWSGPNGPHGDTFDPATDAPGDYVYTVSGPAPCPAVSATLSIAVVPAPNAGTNGLLTLCSDDAPAQLISGLGGSPQQGGSWVGPDGPASGSFVPGTDTPGIYTYTVTGTPPCGNASATVQVTVNLRPHAGSPGTTTVCSNDAAFPLFPLLGGFPDPGGNWTRPNGTPHSGIYTPGTSLPGTYTYTVPGLPPCLESTSTVTIVQVAAPDAGVDRSITVCSDDLPFDLVDELGNTPDPDGQWVGPNGPHGPSFDPANDPPGAYVYTVLGSPPCADASATLNITVRQRPNAGTSATVTLCSTDGQVQLIDALGGADPGGTWTFGGNPVPGTFVPGTSTPGVYTYTVTGQAPCAPSQATVTVVVNTAPFAGVGTTLTVCGNDAPVALVDLLGPGIDAGTWTGPGGAHGGVFDPASDAAGAYTYTVIGQSPCANATAVVNVTVIPPPVAGTDGGVTVCGNDAPFNLFPFLGGGAQGGGSWVGPGGPMSGVFDPAGSIPGTYTYTVAGTAPCTDASATLQVTVVPPPNPGTDGAITVCSSDGPVDLFPLLGVGAQPGGTWVRPSGSAHSGTYLPASEPGGAYTYTVPGTPPCASASASVLVTRITAPNAGVDGSTTVCSTNAPFDLFPLLGGNPNGTGNWVNSGGGAVPATFTPGTSAAGIYFYVVAGTAPCANDTAQVAVNVNTAPVAGSNGSTTVCSSDAPFALSTVLVGPSDEGGTWSGPAGPSNGIFTPGTSPAGGYIYTVVGIAPCPNASAVAVVNVNPQPNAGTGGTFTRCTTDAPVDLFALLGGSPQTGGSWSGPGGPLPSGVFFPATNPSGDYIYTVPGIAPCANATATLAATVNQAPDAGSSGSLTICSGTPEVDLMNVLGGTPDNNGTWSDDDNTGALSGQFFLAENVPPGTYAFTYTVPAIGPCPAASATAEVTIVPGLDAGSNGNLTVCGSNTQVNLFTGLGGAPQSGGQWIDLQGTGALVGNFFNASLVAPGIYSFRYRLSGGGVCDADSAQTTVTVQQPANAGCNGQVTLCSDGPTTALFPFLGCNPDNGGQWRVGSPTGPPFSGNYNPAINDPGVFFYVRNAPPPCGPSFASVTVQEVQQLDPGLPNTVQVCSSGDPFNMFAALGGTPAPGGTWSFNGQPHGPTFVPGLDDQGVYTYTVQGPFPCGVRTANLTVNVVPQASAGVSSARSVCSTDGVFVLIAELGNTAQTGGTWILPSGGTSANTFLTYTPGSSEPGDYLYVVTGTAPCANDTALVSVFQTAAPQAGTPGSVQLCNPGLQVNLFTLLGGNPNQGGTWTGPPPVNAPFTNPFVPGISQPGTYTYTVAPTVPCTTAASSTVSVGVNNQASAGANTSITRCTTQSAFGLIDVMGGNPTPGGTWFGPAPSEAPLAVGFFDPQANAPGTYVYTYRPPVTVGCTQPSATLTIVLTGPANAGNDADLATCTTGAQVNLFNLLGPNAQLGGTWTVQSTGASFSGTFNPAVDQTNTYVYTVQGQGTCPSDQALVSVVNNPPPNAGTGGTFTFCTTSPLQNLAGLLTGAAPGGTWGGQQSQFPGLFQPAIDPPGVYTYTVPGLPGCSAATAQLVINVNPAVEAGQNATVEVCSNGSQVSLFTALGATAQPGGVWTNPLGNTVTSVYTPGISVPGTYRYRIQGQAPCSNDSAFVNVVQYPEPNAGCSGAIQVCSTQPVFSLTSQLACSPDANGVWTFNNQAVDGIFDPSVGTSGVYVYTVPGQSPCAPAVTTLQIQVIDAPNPGVSASVAACVGDVVNLLAALGPSADAGGTWSVSPPTPGLSGNTFNSATAVPGTYTFTYTLAATGPCPSISRTVTVSLNQTIDAGDDATVEACTSETNVDLFAALGPGAQLGGFWIDVDGSAALVGGSFNASAVQPGTWRFDHVVPAPPLSACVNDTARVSVIVQAGPNAGTPGGATLCSTNPPINLNTLLQGSPQGGGFWLGPDLVMLDTPTFLPALSPQGVYYYVVPASSGNCPNDTNTVTISVAVASNAGASASLALCSTDAPVDMFPLLGPNAQPGGTWNGPSGPHTGAGVYNPAVDGPGPYAYTVPGQFPCPSVTATVTVNEQQAPQAGNPNTLSLCSTAGPQSLANLLSPGTTPGGVWNGPFGVLANGLLDPAVHPSGPYVYFLSGAPLCPDASTIISVTVTQQPNAGSSNTVQACITQTAVDLFAALGPNAQLGGTWSGSPALSGNVFNPAAAGLGSYVYTYSFAPAPPCLGASATITVNVTSGASAGTGGDIIVCGADTNFDLFGALGGSPDAGGFWTDILGAGGLQPNGTLNATLLPEGTVGQYGYTVVDPGCGQVSSVLVVTINAFPDPGVGGSLTLCSTDAPIDLFAQLSGAPQMNGSWSGPAGPSAGAFTPGVDAPGNYAYTVPGNQACPDTSAVIAIAVNLPPNAGGDGSIEVCDTLTALGLFGLLSGTPQPGGSWSDISGSGALVGAAVNTTLLAAGTYAYQYTVTVAACGSDAAVVEVQVKDGVEVSTPVTLCDRATRTYRVEFTVSGGDPASYQVVGLTGDFTTSAPWVFTSEALFTSQAFSASISDANGCATVEVSGTSPCSFDTDVFVPEAFSPNGDGINDAFIIPGIEGFPNNRISIFNRWGGLMYEAGGYDNRTVVWNGTSPDGLYAGTAPAGTYYYVLELAQGATPLTGFIYLNR